MPVVNWYSRTEYLRHVSEVLQGGSKAVSGAENLARDQKLFEQVITALLRGSKELGVTQVRNSDAFVQLGKAKSLFEKIKPQLRSILDSSSDLFEVRGAADEIFLGSRNVFDHAAALKKAIAELPQNRLWPSLSTAVYGACGDGFHGLDSGVLVPVCGTPKGKEPRPGPTRKTRMRS